jgi:hypothetical protein
MDLVCETHVWYEIGSGAIRPAGWKAGGHRMVASQLTLFELSSKITPKNFQARKAAAQAVLDYADVILTDPERHFASIWGLAVAATPLDGDGGRIGFRAMAGAADLTALQQAASGMSINTIRATAWREGFTTKFVADIEEMIRTVAKPNYAVRRKSGKMNFLSGAANLKLLRQGLERQEVVDAQVLLTRTRAATHATGRVAEPTPEEIDVARPQVMPFVKAYLKYAERVATLHASAPNDWVDLHFFAYLQGGRVLVTNEGRWIEVAKQAGQSSLVQELNAIR